MAVEPVAAPGLPSRTPSHRLHGIDLARGLAVVCMLLVDNRGSGAIGSQLTHAPWHGLHFADLVFPVFLLIVGVSIPFSRRAQEPRKALARVALLALIGWLVVTAKYGWGVDGPGVLGHIAGAYLLCWILLRLPDKAQIPAAATVLTALSLLFLFVPVPGTGRTAMSEDLSWASWLDGSVGSTLNAEGPHAYLPSAVTVFVGVLAGRVLRDRRDAGALPQLIGLGAGLLAAGLALSPVLPLNKHVWTPSFVLVTGGIGVLFLASTHWLVDLRGLRRPFRPIEVLGLNALVAFVLSEVLFRALLADRVQPRVVGWLGDLTTAGTAAYGYPVLSVLVVWGACAVLVRRGIVVRV